MSPSELTLSTFLASSAELFANDARYRIRLMREASESLPQRDVRMARWAAIENAVRRANNAAA